MAKKQRQHRSPAAVGVIILVLCALAIGVVILAGGRILVRVLKSGVNPDSKPLYEVIDEAVQASYTPRLKYLLDKYGDEFVLTEYGSVYSTRFPDMKVNLLWDKEEKCYLDYYIVYLRQKELKEALLPIVEPIYDECKIYTGGYGYCPPETTKDTTAEQLLETGELMEPLVQLYIFTTKDSDQKDSDLMLLIEGIQNEKYAVAVNVTYLSAENYAIINDDNKYSDMTKKDGFYFWEANVLVSPEEFQWAFRNQWREG